MEPQLIRSLVPYEPASKLEIRVCRIWVTKTIGSDPQAASLDSVFVDKEGDAIHATMNSWDIQFFSDQLNIGCTYEINKFRVIRNRTSSKIVPHNAMIELNRRTTIVLIEKINQVIPMQWFNLVEFDQLHNKVDRDVQLTDVFGCLMALQPTEEVNVQNVRVAKKRNLQIQNIRGDQVRITLWSESATSFQEATLKSLAPPVFIALTALKVKQYQGKPVLGSTGATVYFFNPDIPQLTEYKQKFQYLNLLVEILPSSAERYTKPHMTADSELKTIEELLLLDPTLNKDTNFMCQATIVGYDLSKGWWYKSCPSCHKSAKKNVCRF